MSTAQVAIIWTGPSGQVWPYKDEQLELVAGQRYQVDADFAAYLCEAHPDHWQRPAVKTPPQAAKE